MTALASPQVWVFTAGALGDFVLTWPLVRALARGGGGVTVAADGQKARLAAAEIDGVVGVDAQQRRFTRLWAGRAEERIAGVGRVITFASDKHDEPGRRWFQAAADMFPDAVIEAVGGVGSATRAAAWARERVGELGRVPPRDNPNGPIILHVGAGSREKLWQMERWAETAAVLRTRALHIRVIAGEVEHERFTGHERAAFSRLGGVFLDDLSTLADGLRDARAMIGCDSGPTHLAAQMGLRTVAVFGPTDPAVWSPVGAQGFVRTVAAGSGRTADVPVGRLLGALDEVMGEPAA